MQHQSSKNAANEHSGSEERAASHVEETPLRAHLIGVGGKAVLLSAGVMGGWFAHEKLVNEPIEALSAELNGRIDNISHSHAKAMSEVALRLESGEAALPKNIETEVLRLRAKLLQELNQDLDQLRIDSAGATMLLSERYEKLRTDVESNDCSLGARLSTSEAELVRLESNYFETQERVAARLEVLSQAIANIHDEDPRDLITMWRDLVGPVVQLEGDSSVGSGVLLKSEYSELTREYITPILTAWHVVRDIQGEPANTSLGVPTAVYAEDGSTSQHTAKLLAHDVLLDLALLELRTSSALPNGAKLPTPQHLGSIKIFDEIYAVGCPLGNDPIPTRGEVASLRHEVDGQEYWMLNAQTYIGNSGGGIFDADGHELLGIFSKIYTHGSIRPSIVPHMGLAVPMDKVYSWLEKSGYLSYVSHPGAESSRLALQAASLGGVSNTAQISRER